MYGYFEPSWASDGLASSPVEQGLSAGTRRAVRWSFVGLLLSTTLFQRVGINFGAYSLNAALLGMYGAWLVCALASSLLLSKRRTAIYAACMGIAAVSLSVNQRFANVNQASTASFFLLATMYLPFCFALRPGALAADDSAWALEAFSNVALFCGVAGIAQFYAQWVIRADWLFDFTPYLPEVLRGPSGYNTVIPVGSLYKSNGFFFREPSGFSFIMALALVAEWVTRKRFWRIACFGLALLLTYSGTGIFALFIGMLFPLGKKTLVRLLALAVAGGLAIGLLGETLNLSFTLNRVEEFGAERSSAYIRYIAPFRLIDETLTSEAWSAWLGHGPGAISREFRSYEFHDPTWAKLLFEYGAIGCVAFLGFIVYVTKPREVPAQLRAMLFFSWLMMGGHLLSPEQNFLTLALMTRGLEAR